MGKTESKQKEEEVIINNNAGSAMNSMTQGRLLTDIELILIVLGLIVIFYFVTVKIKKLFAKEIKRQITVSTI